MKKLLATAAIALAAQTALADNLKFHTYNPEGNGIFPVASVIVEGDKELMLVDAQFQRNDAQALVKQIQAIGKPLKTIYISHGDPDYYFGLDVVTQAFPDAKVIATPETVAHIKGTLVGKYEYWSPILEKNAPKALVIPEAYAADELNLGTSHIAIKGKQYSPRTYLWDADSKTIFGGVQLSQNMHVWLADTQTPEQRAAWLKTLAEMQSLKPQTVIAGHYFGKSTPEAIGFTQSYIKTFEQALSGSKNSGELMAKMKQAYPKLEGESDLETSAKVLTGEMKW